MRSMTIVLAGLATVAGVTVHRSLFAQAGAPANAQADADRQVLRTHAETTAYGVGFHLGEDIRRGLEADAMTLDTELLVRGFADALNGRAPAVDRREIDRVLNAVHREMTSRMVERRCAEDPAFAELCRANLERSRAFVKEFAAKPGVQQFEEGVYYRVDRAGNGPTPGFDDAIVATYRITGADGRVIEEAQGRAKDLAAMLAAPARLMATMPAGSRWTIVIAPEQAHGLGGDPPLIQPNEVLIADVELVEVRP